MKTFGLIVIIALGLKGNWIFSGRGLLREPNKLSTRPLGTVQVKGRAEGIEIFAVH